MKFLQGKWQSTVTQELAISEISFTFALRKKQLKFFNDVAKVKNKSDKPVLFGEFFSKKGKLVPNHPRQLTRRLV